MTDLVRAAGGVVWRGAPDGHEVLLVHRSRYDDWSLPKGKLDPGETWEQAAIREVFEETGVVAVLGAELSGASYDDHNGRPKQVRYWAMTVAVATPFEPDDEVDALEWLDVDAATRRLTYPRDAVVVASFAASQP